MSNGKAIIAVSLLLLVGCTWTPKPVPYESARYAIATRHFAGTILTGPGPGSATGAFELVTVHITALEHLPAPLLTAVSDAAQLITVHGGGATFAAAPRLAPAAQFGVGLQALQAYEQALAAGKFGRHEEVATLSGAIAAGVTVHFGIKSADVEQQAATGLGYAIAVEAGQDVPTGLALIIKGYADTPQSGQDEQPELDSVEPKLAAILLEETVILGDMPSRAPRVAVILAACPTIAGRGVAIVVQRHGKADEEQAAAYAQAVQRCQADLDTARLDDTVRDTAAPIWAGLTEALKGLADSATQRSALAYLGRMTGAAAAADVALSASDEMVAEIGLLACAAAAELSTPLEAAAVGWALQRSTFQVLGAQLEAEPRQPAVESLLTRHAGEAGRQWSDLRQVLQRCASLEDLAANLFEQNLIFLEDKSAAGRVRAYDWLVRRGRAPEGYDPLAPRRQRRAALSRWSRQQEGQR